VQSGEYSRKALRKQIRHPLKNLYFFRNSAMISTDLSLARERRRLRFCRLPLRRFFLPLCCLFLCAALFACAEKSGPDFSRPGSGAGHAAGVSPEAGALYAEALAFWPEGLSSLRSAERCSDPEQAVALLDKALGLAPNFADAHIRRGLARSELGRKEEAFDDLTVAVRLQPTARAYAFRGLLSLRDGQERAARRDLAHSLSLDPSRHEAYNYLGVLALSLGDKQEACSRFDAGCSRGDCTCLEAARKEKLCPWRAGAD
jgi:tetratricopeptide (TPR) repeat protein